MTKNRQIRVVKRGSAAGESAAPASDAGRHETSEREMKTIVSGWVREHRQRAEEFRSTFSSLLRESGFNPPRGMSRA